MQTANIDISQNGTLNVFQAMQGDTDRQIQVSLFDAGSPYDVSTAAVSVWYDNFSGNAGNFSNGISVSGNAITITLNGNLTAASGNYGVVIMLNESSGKISSWNIGLIVNPVPGYGSTAAGDYFEAFQAGDLAAQINELNARVSTIIANGTSTEGNTELIDIRTAWNGTVYPTAGDAVRAQAEELNEEIQNLGFSKMSALSIGSGVANASGGDTAQATTLFGSNYHVSIDISESSSFGLVGFELAESYEDFGGDELTITVKNLSQQACSTGIVLTNSAYAWGGGSGSVLLLGEQSVSLQPLQTQQIVISPSSYASSYTSNPSASKQFCVLIAKKSASNSRSQNILVNFYNSTQFSQCQGFDSSNVNFPLYALNAQNAILAETAQAASSANFAHSANPLSFAPESNYQARSVSSDTGTGVITFDPILGFATYSKAEGTLCTYAGLYIHVPEEWINDTLSLSVEGNITPFLAVVSGLSDWGGSPGLNFFTSNNVSSFSLATLISENPSYFTNPGNIYITALGYSASGISKEVNVTARLTNISNDYHVVADVLTDDLQQEIVTQAVEQAQQGNSYITCWGDSLTAMGGWTTELQTLSGMTVNNGGTGGENSQTIMARQGGDIMTINNITIPATTTPVLIASRSTETGIPTWFGNKVTPLLQGGGSHVNPCRIGDVMGTLAWTGSSYSDPDGTWTFTRSTAGEAVTIDRPTAIRTNFDMNKNSPHLMIIFMGQNGGWSDNDDLIWQHQRMIDHAHAKNILVLGLSSGSAESRQSYEAAMQREFGRYFLSLRQYLAHPIYDGQGTAAENIVSCYGLADAGLTPTDQDLDAIRTGTVPPQCLIDSVHYTTATRTVVGQLIYKYCRELNLF